MSVTIKMHEYAPREGHVLRRFRCPLPSGGKATFEAGGVYRVKDEDAEHLLAVRSRPDVTANTVPLAFDVVDAEPAPPAPVKSSGDLTTADLPKVKDLTADKPAGKPAKPKTRKPKDE